MHRLRNRQTRWSAFLAATLAGGTLFGTCETRIRDSFITGTKSFVFNLLNPSNLSIDFGNEPSAPEDTTN